MQAPNVYENNSITGIYTRRWLLLVATCLCTLLTDFLSESFAAANEIFAVYFQVSLAKLDWTCAGLDAGTGLITPIFAYLCFIQVIGFRAMSICGSTCLLLSCICIILTVQFPFLFPLMVAATLLQGVAYCAAFSVGTVFAVLWFPDHQVGLAIACNSASMMAGFILSSTLPPSLLQNPPFDKEGTTSMTLQNNLSNIIYDEWKSVTYKNLMFMYSTTAVIFFLILLIFCLFASDLPPKAPTLALALKRISTSKTEIIRSFKGFINDTKVLFQDGTYLLCIGISGITYNMIIVEMVHLSQFINHIDDKISASLTSAYILTAFSVSGFVSSFIAAKALRFFQRYTCQVIVGSGLLLGSGICLLLSYYYKILLGFYIGNIVWGVGSRICNIPLFEIVTRHTYPKDETIVTVWMAGIGTTIIVVIVGATRLLTTYLNSISGLIFINAFLLFAFFASFFLKPKNNRGEVDQELIDEDINEYTPLATAD